MTIAATVAAAANRSDLRAMNTYDAQGRQGPKNPRKIRRFELIFWDGTVVNVSNTDFDLYCKDITFTVGLKDARS